MRAIRIVRFAVVCYNYMGVAGRCILHEFSAQRIKSLSAAQSTIVSSVHGSDAAQIPYVYVSRFDCSQPPATMDYFFTAIALLMFLSLQELDGTYQLMFLI